MSYEMIQIPVDEIKFFVRRARPEMPYSRLKDSIREVGLKTPIGVRDISDRPKSKRRRSDGGYHKYELVYGQGRLQAFRELDIAKIPAIVVAVSEEEIVGRFLAENMMRRKLSWSDKARLIKADVMDHGLTVEEVAKRYCITQSHAKKYLRVMNGASQKALDRAEAGELDMNATEKLTTISKKDQDVVIEVMDEEGLDKSSVMQLVDEAAKIRKANETPSKDSLKGFLDDVNAELRLFRGRFKYKRLEYGLGPQNIFRLCEDEAFVVLATQKGIDLGHFVDLT
ncbi:MAG: ParB N-terminal domain-containing protein [Planctomycetes bacterium]|nr:ParB N-terminal domain-containing protein [Planctomycetota bacterium]